MLSSLFSWYFTRKALPYWCILLLDCLIIVASGIIATYLVLGGDGIIQHFWQQLATWIAILPLYMVGMRINHTYSGIVRYSSFVDLMRVSCALLIGVALTILVFFLLPEHLQIRHRILALSLLLAMIGQWSVRILAKYIFDTSVKGSANARVYIYGVHEGGASIAKSIRNQHPLRYLLKGFIADDAATVGHYLLGVHVHEASIATIQQMKEQGVTILFVSPLCNEQLRNNQELVNALLKAGITIMMMSNAKNGMASPTSATHSSRRSISKTSSPATRSKSISRPSVVSSADVASSSPEPPVPSAPEWHVKSPSSPPQNWY